MARITKKMREAAKPTRLGRRPEHTSEEDPDREVLMSFSVPIWVRERAMAKAAKEPIIMSQFLREKVFEFLGISPPEETKKARKRAGDGKVSRVSKVSKAAAAPLP